MSRRVNRYYPRYQQHVLANARFIDVKGLATVGSYTPDLDDVFV